MKAQLAGAAAEKEEFDGKMHFENGMAQPMLNYSTVDTPNDKSDILRLCIYVETDHDTDGDGKADLVKACGIGTYGSEGFELCRIALFRR